MQEEIDKEARAPLFPWWFWFLGLGICLVWYFGPEIVEWRGGKSEPENSGEFGDLYGVINALFSGLAFLGVLVGIFIQGREFRLQLKEMSVSTREMTEQSKTYKEQLASLQFQNKEGGHFRKMKHGVLIRTLGTMFPPPELLVDDSDRLRHLLLIHALAAPLPSTQGQQQNFGQKGSSRETKGYPATRTRQAVFRHAPSGREPSRRVLSCMATVSWRNPSVSLRCGDAHPEFLAARPCPSFSA